MDSFVQRFSDKIKGTLCGFDRIVFKGSFRHLMFAKGVAAFLSSKGVLNKNYKDWVMSQSRTLIRRAEELAMEKTGEPARPFKTSERKEEVAHRAQTQREIKEGLIGVWSAVESCYSYKARYDEQAGFPQIHSYATKCKHLYFYLDHPVFGFMSIRLQTWFPYSIQIALNGREWLRRSLDCKGIDYIAQGNKFLYLSDYEMAQNELSVQTQTQFQDVLDPFARLVFPDKNQILGSLARYYWSLWQSEWATDYIFDSAQSLQPLTDHILHHAWISGHSERVLRYMGKPVSPNGQPHPLAEPELMSRLSEWYDGKRVRHWLNQNSVKIYNEQNVLRVETTLNNPGDFRIWRHSDKKPDEPKKRLPMRKGIADIPQRAQISADINRRVSEQLAGMETTTPIKDQLINLTRPVHKNGRKARALDLFGKDRELLLALSDPAFALNGITNKKLQELLRASAWANGKSGNALSGRISRHLRILRAHGILRKMPNQNRYLLTPKGQQSVTTLSMVLESSSEQLMKVAA